MQWSEEANTLSVRDLLGQTASVRPVRVSGSRAALNAERIILLIHGFNNTPAQAGQSFKSFSEALAREAASVGREPVGAVWEFYWPGDHPNSVISALTYSQRIQVAITAGEKLAQFITKTFRPSQEIVVIAHSLGCRVAVSMLQALNEEGDDAKALPNRLFLMAAAVPQALCSADGRYYPKASWRPIEHVFHSRDDRVLQLFFDPGQKLFSEPGRAVGRYGGPANRWDREIATSLDHGEYWTDSYITNLIARDLHLSTSRFIEERRVMEWLPFELNIESTAGDSSF